MRAATNRAIVAMVLCMAGPLAAQEDTVDQVQDGMKSPGIALLLEAHPFIPLIGHWYAGDVKRGILPTVVNLGGLPLAVMCLDIIGDSGCSDTKDMIFRGGCDRVFCRLGVAHVLGTRDRLGSESSDSGPGGFGRDQLRDSVRR